MDEQLHKVELFYLVFLPGASGALPRRSPLTSSAPHESARMATAPPPFTAEQLAWLNTTFAANHPTPASSKQADGTTQTDPSQGSGDGRDSSGSSGSGKCQHATANYINYVSHA